LQRYEIPLRVEVRRACRIDDPAGVTIAGEVDLDLASEGLCCEIVFPLS
jgi:hypothetical protein